MTLAVDIIRALAPLGILAGTLVLAVQVWREAGDGRERGGGRGDEAEALRALGRVLGEGRTE